MGGGGLCRIDLDLGEVVRYTATVTIKENQTKFFKCNISATPTKECSHAPTPEPSPTPTDSTKCYTMPTQRRTAKMTGGCKLFIERKTCPSVCFHFCDKKPTDQKDAPERLNVMCSISFTSSRCKVRKKKTIPDWKQHYLTGKQQQKPPPEICTS